jgi:hypothetical protein
MGLQEVDPLFAMGPELHIMKPTALPKAQVQPARHIIEKLSRAILIGVAAQAHYRAKAGSVDGRGQARDGMPRGLGLV